MATIVQHRLGIVATMVDYKDRLAAAMTDAKVSTRQLAKSIGISYQAVKKVLDGDSRSFTAINNDLAAKRLNVSPTWLATGEEEAQYEQSRTPTALTLAESPKEYNTPPPTLKWEHIMQGKLPERFAIEIVDNSMELSDPPSMRIGDIALFRCCRKEEVKPGDVVLVADREDNLYIRKIQSRTPSRWQAVARNSAYTVLDSVEDGLRVIAVQTGVTWA